MGTHRQGGHPARRSRPEVIAVRCITTPRSALAAGALSFAPLWRRRGRIGREVFVALVVVVHVLLLVRGLVAAQAGVQFLLGLHPEALSQQQVVGKLVRFDLVPVSQRQQFFLKLGDGEFRVDFHADTQRVDGGSQGGQGAGRGRMHLDPFGHGQFFGDDGEQGADG